MESLRFDEFPHEQIVLSRPLHLLIILPFNVALKIEEVLRALHFPIAFVILLIPGFLLLVRPIEPNIVVDCHEQEVEKELLDAQLCVCPVLLIELLVELALAETFRFAVLVLGPERRQPPIFLVHHVLQTGKKIVTER